MDRGAKTRSDAYTNKVVAISLDFLNFITLTPVTLLAHVEDYQTAFRFLLHPSRPNARLKSISDIDPIATAEPQTDRKFSGPNSRRCGRKKEKPPSRYSFRSDKRKRIRCHPQCCATAVQACGTAKAWAPVAYWNWEPVLARAYRTPPDLKTGGSGISTHKPASRRAVGRLDKTGHCQLRHVSDVGIIEPTTATQYQHGGNPLQINVTFLDRHRARRVHHGQADR